MLLIPKPTHLVRSLSARFKIRQQTLNLDELEAVLGHYTLHPWRVGRVLRGGNSFNVAVETKQGRKVLKRYYWSVPSTQYEHAILRHLAGTHFPTPQLVPNKAGQTYTELGQAHYALYNFAPGYCYTNFFASTRTRRSLVAQAGQALAQFHELMAGFVPEGRKLNGYRPDGRRLWRDLLWHLDVIDHYAYAGQNNSPDELDAYLSTIIPELRDELEAVSHHFVRADEDLPKAIIHGDYSPKNVFFFRGRLSAVLDFGDACLNLRALDVARGLTAFARAGRNRLSPSLATTFLTAYQAGTPLRAPEVAAIPDLIRWRFLQNIVWTLFHLEAHPGQETRQVQLSAIRWKWAMSRWLKQHQRELQLVLRN